MNMQDERQGGDPEDRAFTGAPDMPPKDPDQPREGNEELERGGGGGDGDAERPEGGPGGNPHGDYPNLPGYGG